MSEHTTYEIAVVGAGSAGLQAALTLGRMRRRVALFDTGRYRNDPTDAMHNFLGHDGESPASLRAAARADVTRYATVELREQAVSRITADGDGFRLDVEGAEPVTAGRIVLATGVADTLPELPGLADLFGAEVAHCPFCHGFEYADRPVGILGAAPHVPMMARVFDRIASEVVVLTGGEELADETATALKRDERELVTTPLSGVARSAGGLTVSFDDGSTRELGGLMVKPEWRQAAPFAEQLGLEMSPVGAVVVDSMGRTSLPGVYAAGDMAQGPGMPQPMASVLVAAAAGQIAAAACQMDSLAD